MLCVKCKAGQFNCVELSETMLSLLREKSVPKHVNQM